MYFKVVDINQQTIVICHIKTNKKRVLMTDFFILLILTYTHYLMLVIRIRIPLFWKYI